MGFLSDLNILDSPTSLLRIKPPEGAMMAIKKGTPDGPFHMIIASLTGWHFRYQEVLQHMGISSDNPFDRRLEEVRGLTELNKWDLLEDIRDGIRYYSPHQQGMLEKEFGIIVPGPGKALHIPRNRYQKWKLNEEGTGFELRAKIRADSPYFFFQYDLGIPAKEIETKGALRVSIVTNLVVRMMNPYNAQFLVGDWEDLLNAAVNGKIRDALSDMEIKAVQAIEEGGMLYDKIMSLNDGIKNPDGSVKVLGFKAKFGIQIDSVQFVGFKIEGGTDVIRALEAEQVAELLLSASKKDAEKIRTLGAATADAARMLREAQGSAEAAAEIRVAELMADAIKGTRATVVSLGGGMPFTMPLPEARKK